MKFFLIVIFSILSTSFAYANSDWRYITSTVDGDQFLIDQNSILKQGDSVTFWYRRNFSIRDKFGNLSSKVQKTINCRTRDGILRFMLIYDDVNNMGKLTNSYNPNDSWEPIPPDTIFWRFLLHVCSR